jgi:methylamine dehydrogenase accessory protein MauD
VAPAGALQPTEGPKVGELTDAMKLEGLDGRAVTIGGEHPDGLATLVLFVSPTCPVCRSLVPTAKSLARKEASRLRLVFASDGDEQSRHLAYARDLALDGYPYVLSQALGMTYQVSKLPFALLVGADGTLQSKGLVNTREHLESLIEAMDSGVATLQEYVGRMEAEAGIDTTVKEQVS